MIKYPLIFIALISFSIVSSAAAIPTDAGQAISVTIPNAVLHKEVAVIQGGDSDKDVAAVLTVAAIDVCSSEAACNGYKASTVGNTNTQSMDGWFVAQESTSVLQPVMVLVLIIGFIVFFLMRKSTSTK